MSALAGARHWWAPVSISVIGVAAFLVLPMLLAAATQTLGLDAAEVGVLSSAAMGGSALSSLAAVFWVRRLPWRTTAAAAFVVMIVAYAAVGLGGARWHVVLGAMFVAGAAGGAAYALALTALSDLRESEAAFGYSIAAQVSFQVVGLALLPGLIARHGLPGMLALFMLLAAAGVVLACFLPVRSRRHPTPDDGAQPVPRRLFPVALALVGCFAFFFNVGVIWTYVERIAAAAGLAPEWIGISLAIGVAAGIPGALLAAMSARRWGPARSVVLAGTLAVIAVALLTPSMARWTLMGSMALYNFAWNYSLAFQYAIVNAADSSGRAVAAAPAFHAFGAAAGPAVAALMVRDRGFDVVVVLAASAVVVSALALLGAQAMGRHNRARA